MSLLTFLSLTHSTSRSSPVIAEGGVEEPGGVVSSIDGGDADESEEGGAEEKPPHADRDSKGRFAPGNSGSPGRPKGSLSRTTIEAQKRLAEAGGSKVVAMALKLAAQGEPAVVTALLKHILPRQRAALTPFLLPAGELTEAGLRSAATDVLRLVAEGEMTAAEGREAMAMIEQARSIVLADELAKRVDAVVARGGAVEGGEPMAGPEGEP